MWKGSNLWERMMEQTTHGTSVPYQTIIEISGYQRVLIENHRGVITYGNEKIVVKVKYGSISLCGYGLEIVHMTNEQLVICGKIQSVSLHRRDGN